MTARDFVYWLNGYFEISGTPDVHLQLNSSQVATIKQHLAMVFIHEIDPSMGALAHQAKLDAAHSPKTHWTHACRINGGTVELRTGVECGHCGAVGAETTPEQKAAEVPGFDRTPIGHILDGVVYRC